MKNKAAALLAILLVMGGIPVIPALGAEPIVIRGGDGVYIPTVPLVGLEPGDGIHGKTDKADKKLDPSEEKEVVALFERFETAVLKTSERKEIQREARVNNILPALFAESKKTVEEPEGAKPTEKNEALFKLLQTAVSSVLPGMIQPKKDDVISITKEDPAEREPESIKQDQPQRFPQNAGMTGGAVFAVEAGVLQGQGPSPDHSQVSVLDSVWINQGLAAADAALHLPSYVHPYVRALLKYEVFKRQEVMAALRVMREKIKTIYERAKQGRGLVRYNGIILQKAFLPLIDKSLMGSAGDTYELVGVPKSIENS